MNKHRLFRAEYFVGRGYPLGVASHVAAIYNQELEQFAWPGGYIILYIDAEGSTLCAPCAMRTFPTPTATAYHEGPLLHCDQCGCELDSTTAIPIRRTRMPNDMIPMTGELMPALSMEQVAERRNAVVEFTRAAMTDGVDFGTIPGTTKPRCSSPAP